MTFKIIELLKLIRSKTLHIFLCLVLIFAFCFKDSVPSAEAVNSEDYLMTAESGGTERSEAAAVYAQAAPLPQSSLRLPSYDEAAAYTSEAADTVQDETENAAETGVVSEDSAIREETPSEEVTAEETTDGETTDGETTEGETAEEEIGEDEITEEETERAEETTAETAAEETAGTADAPVTEAPSEPSASLNGAYGQRYQEQWEIDYANQLFDLVNAEREKYGAAPLKKMDALTDAAVERAWEVTRFNSHTRPDGTSCFTVLPQHGLELSKRAENIAYYSSTPQAAFNSLMSNYSHREPMLSSRFEYMGVGFYCVYDDVSGYHYYWTQIFYTP